MNELSRIQSALACIPPHDRETWVMVGMALHSLLGPDGFKIWDDWAATADNHNARDARTVWKSFKPGKITIASLYHEALLHGWKPEKPIAPLSPAELAEREQLRIQRQQQAEAEEAERQAKNERLTEIARRLWFDAMPMTDHQYIERKGIKIFDMGKVQQAEYLKGDDGKPLTALSGLCLLLPIKRDNRINALQVIQSDGERRFIGSPKGGALTLGKIKGAQRILIAEGFATAASLHEATGLPTVCAFSAGNLLAVAQRLRAALPSVELVLCADCDAHGKGQQKAVEAAKAVEGHVSLPDFSNIPDGEAKTKASDFNDLHQLASIEEVARQVATTRKSKTANSIKPDVDRVEIIRAADITPEPIRWLWDGWLAGGKLIILAGAPGTGKTTLTMELAAVVTTGGLWPDGSRAQHGNVLIWSGEDDPKDTLVPRLHAAGADLNRVFFVGNTVPAGAESRSFDPSRDLAALTHAIAAAGEIHLMIVDPIVSAVAGDSHKNAEVRRSLQPLVDLAIKLDCALIGITHLSKGTQGRDPIERVTGSIAFGALARIVLITAKTKDDSNEACRILVRAKSNIGPEGNGFRYNFEQTELEHFPGVIASRILWGDAVEGEARVLLADPQDNDGIDDIDGWLKDALAAGAMKSKDVKRLGELNGFSYDQLKRAKKRLGISDQRQGFGKDSMIWWCPPNSPIQSTSAHTEHAEQPVLSAPYALYEESTPKISEKGGNDEAFF